MSQVKPADAATNGGRHRVAVTVPLDADDVDLGDTHHVPQTAVAEVWGPAGGKDDVPTAHTPIGYPRKTQVMVVIAAARQRARGIR